MSDVLTDGVGDCVRDAVRVGPVGVMLAVATLERLRVIERVASTEEDSDEDMELVARAVWDAVAVREASIVLLPEGDADCVRTLLNETVAVGLSLRDVAGDSVTDVVGVGVSVGDSVGRVRVLDVELVRVGVTVMVCSAVLDGVIMSVSDGVRVTVGVLVPVGALERVQLLLKVRVTVGVSVSEMLSVSDWVMFMVSVGVVDAVTVASSVAVLVAL